MREIPRQQKRPHRNQQQDNDRKPNRRNRLCDGERSAEAEEFERHKIVDSLFAPDAFERLGCGGGEGVVFEEEEDFEGDAVCFEGLDAHDEEESCEYALWN